MHSEHPLCPEGWPVLTSRKHYWLPVIIFSFKDVVFQKIIWFPLLCHLKCVFIVARLPVFVVASAFVFRLVFTFAMIPQTGLALMGFSRYCPSSLDLTNFVVRECRGATAEECSSRSKSAQAWPRPRSGNLEIWGPGNPEMWDPTVQKNKKSQNTNPFCPKCWQGLD